MRLLCCSLPLLFLGCTSPRTSNPAVTLNPESIAGRYEGLLRSAKVTLELRPDSTGEMTTESSGTGIVHQPGRWSSLPPQVRFDFRPESGRRAESMTWTIQGDELVALVWDKAAFGETGLRLRRAR